MGALTALPILGHPDTAAQRQIMKTGAIVEIAEVDGLHHRYERIALWKSRPEGLLAIGC